MAKTKPADAEALAYLREWAAAGFPKRADGSFPTDFLAAFRRVALVSDDISTRTLEDRLVAMPDADALLGWRHVAHLNGRTPFG